MKFFQKTLSTTEIAKLQEESGDYLKVTADIENKWIVVGCELHADGERVLLEKGSKNDDIWGGGIDLKEKIIDTTAVLNLRSSLGNDSMEILDPERREKFVKIVKEFFKEL